MRKELIDLTGRRFGRLVVIERAPGNYNRITQHADGSKIYSSIPRWVCKCDCGNVKTVLGNNLKSGGAKSCGCITKERLREMNVARRKHER